RLAPAKINLAHHGTGQRQDGYHLLDILVAFADTGELLHVEEREKERREVSGRFREEIPTDSSNLRITAREMLRREFGKDLPPVFIRLEKNLPIASGIGGGSSDAAATLLALNDFWQLGLATKELFRLALPLGADLPMCLHGADSGTP